MSGFMALLGARPAPVDGAMLRERDSGRSRAADTPTSTLTEQLEIQSSATCWRAGTRGRRLRVGARVEQMLIAVAHMTQRKVPG
jgi:hypothetical protein